MLQRLNSKPPTVLKPNPNDAVIFNKDGKLKDQYYKICLEININPDELYPQTLESFKEPGMIKNVQILRYNNWENKRRGTTYYLLFLFSFKFPPQNSMLTFVFSQN